jgi:MSHA biogenesis protein MshN
MDDIPMSLINRMLQDLDARSGGNQGAIVPQPAVRPVVAAEKSSTLMVGAVVLCLVAGAAGAWYWFANKAASTPAASPVTVPTSQASNAGAVKVAAVAAQPTASPQAINTGPASTNAAAVAVAPTVVAATQVSAIPVAGSVAEKPLKVALTKQANKDTKSPIVASTTLAPAPTASLKKRAEAPEAPAENPPVAAVQPKVVAAARESASVPAKQVRELTPYQRAENEYRRASGLAVQGKSTEAMTALEQSLQLDPRHVAARQMLASMLVEAGRSDEALSQLKAGLALDQTQPSLAMALARLQVEKGDAKGALQTLQGGLPYAVEFGDYHAFLAALLQRQERHKEAVDEYGAALKLVPQNGLWWMGIGISLQADNRMKEAREAYDRAKTSNTLPPDLLAFVDQKLSQLPR